MNRAARAPGAGPLGRPILFVSGEYPPDAGGVGDYTARLAAALGALDPSLDLSVLTRDRPSTGVTPGGPTLLGRVQRWDARTLGTIVRATPPNGMVHLQYQAAAFSLRGEICLAPLALRARRPDARVVTTFHDARAPYLFPKAGRLRPLAVRLLARTSHAVIAAEPADLAQLGGPSPRHHQVPIGSNVDCAPPAAYDRAAFRATLGLAGDGLAIAYFGFLNHSKGLDTLLDVFARVSASRPAARLLLLGGSASASDPTDRATADRVEARLAPLRGRIHRPGYLQPADLSAYLLAADVALLPYADGASMRRGSLLACAVHGLPIVTTTPAGGARLLREVVLACTPGDAVCLAEIVVRVATDRALAGRLRDGSARLAAAVSWPRIAAHHLRIYRTLGIPPRRGDAPPTPG